MTASFRVKKFEVGEFLNPYIIAEIGVNHGGSLDLAKKLIDDAVEGGANAAKFQTYKANKIASKNSPAYWDLEQEPTQSQFQLFQKYDQFGEREYKILASYCEAKGIDFLSTPFDLEAVDFLAPLVPVFKIASADITNVPLLRKCASKKKPLILSTGAATLSEIEAAVAEVRRSGATEIALLHCVLNYPTAPEAAQLGMITTLARVFPDCVIGYSDHVVPDATMSSMEAALMLGATILEKHFTSDKQLPGNDHYHAMDAVDLKGFCSKVELFQTLVSKGGKDLRLETAARTHARRSIVAARNIEVGELLSDSNLVTKRPGHGISPIHWDDVVGRRAACPIDEDELLSWRSISADSTNEKS